MLAIALDSDHTEKKTSGWLIDQLQINQPADRWLTMWPVSAELAEV